jgi:hypothetical protein
MLVLCLPRYFAFVEELNFYIIMSGKNVTYKYCFAIASLRVSF